MYYTVNLNQDKSAVHPYISHTLLEGLKKVLNQKKKAILYLNKRGDFSGIVCTDCQFLFKCYQCDNSLCVHEKENSLICHYCGYNLPIPLHCPECHGTQLKKIGVGTKQIESTLQKLFPSSAIYRLDMDSAKNVSEKKMAIEHLQKADIIIGTKMITTGIDLQNISLIGVILLEQELLSESYDGEEDVYINIKQLLGRSREKDATLLIQTYIPDHTITTNITQKNYKDFFLYTLHQRKQFHLPPFLQRATIEFRHQNLEKSKSFLHRLEQKLQMLDIEKSHSISLSGLVRKKYNKYHCFLHISGDNLRNFLEPIREEISKNSQVSIKFD